jgi:hypothetical protein
MTLDKQLNHSLLNTTAPPQQSLDIDNSKNEAINSKNKIKALAKKLDLHQDFQEMISEIIDQLPRYKLIRHSHWIIDSLNLETIVEKASDSIISNNFENFFLEVGKAANMISKMEKALQWLNFFFQNQDQINSLNEQTIQFFYESNIPQLSNQQLKETFQKIREKNQEPLFLEEELIELLITYTSSSKKLLLETKSTLLTYLSLSKVTITQ